MNIWDFHKAIAVSTNDIKILRRVYWIESLQLELFLFYFGSFPFKGWIEGKMKFFKIEDYYDGINFD